MFSLDWLENDDFKTEVFVIKKYIIYDVTNDELEILNREGFEFVKDPPYLGSETWNVMFECDKPYFDMALHAIRRA